MSTRTTTALPFSSLLRRKREQRGLGLREFARRANLDPSNYARFESIVRPTVPSEETLKRIAFDGLELEEDSEEWDELRDAASLAQGKLPLDILLDARAMELLFGELPDRFRVIRTRRAAEAKQAAKEGPFTAGRRKQTRGRSEVSSQRPKKNTE